MKQGIKRYGVPLALYSDKHIIFRSPDEKLMLDEELDGVRIPLSNFGKAMEELSIGHIKANTPQAKGRVERLWETLQYRLPVELRLLGVHDIETANKKLPGLLRRHNQRYAVLPAETQDAYRPVGLNLNLECVFALRDTMKVGGSGEITYKKAIYVPRETCYCLNARTTV